MPDVVVEIGRFDGFTLDDPVLGRLDENPLDSTIVFTEIPQGVFAVSVSRGRDRDIGRTSAGTMSVSLRNQDRFFDPFIGAFFLQSTAERFPFRRFVRPQLPIRASVNGEPMFTGFVDDWDFDYSPSGESIASIKATDFFSQFARRNNQGGAAAQENTGDRLDRVLSQASVNFLLGRDIDTGNSTLAAGVLEGSSLESLLSVVEASEFGLVFMAKDGTFVFRERLINPQVDSLIFSDNGVGIPYEDLKIEFGSEELVNRVTVTNETTSVTLEDIQSQVDYGLRETEFSTQVATESGLTALAGFVLQKFSEPDYRFKSLTTNLRRLSADEVEDVLGLEIGDQVTVRFTPNGIGSAISIRNRIIGVSHSVGLDSHLVTFNFENLPFVFLVLDDDPLGIMDFGQGVLGF